MDIVSQIKADINFPSFIARYTGGLKPSNRAGRWFLGFCPFCQADRRGRPRFWVDTANGLCNCFKPACKSNKPMDIINFIARLEGISNQDAIKKLLVTPAFMHPAKIVTKSTQEGE
jgi:hypothetical protein